MSSHVQHRRSNAPSIIRPIPIWALRVAWATLPLTAGAAAGAALRDWSDAPRIAAEALLWISWGVGLLATVAPRPLGLAALRTIAPAYLVLAIVVAVDGSPSTIATVGAVVATAITAVLAAGDDIALASANSASYGDELRVPLRTPPALFLGPIPLARLLVVAAVAAPVLLLAAEEWVWGALALVVGVALLAVLPNALFRLSRRWAVLVPAGFVIVDPMTLADPVLFLREHITTLGAAPDRGTRRAPTPRTFASARRGGRSSCSSTEWSTSRSRRADGDPRRRCRPTTSGSRPSAATSCSRSRARAGSPFADPAVGPACTRLLRDTAAEAELAVVERDHLARRNTRLGRRELHDVAVEGRVDRLAVRAHLHLQPRRQRHARSTEVTSRTRTVSRSSSRRVPMVTVAVAASTSTT